MVFLRPLIRFSFLKNDTDINSIKLIQKNTIRSINKSHVMSHFPV